MNIQKQTYIMGLFYLVKGFNITKQFQDAPIRSQPFGHL